MNLKKLLINMDYHLQQCLWANGCR